MYWTLAAVSAMFVFAIARNQETTRSTSSNGRPRTECRWVESEYRDDVSITTCDAVATISVRFMSLGPGLCAVEARETRTVQPGRVGVTALPGVWSTWLTVQSHLGVYRTKIENDVKCDTGVRSQIRYSAPK